MKSINGLRRFLKNVVGTSRAPFGLAYSAGRESTLLLKLLSDLHAPLYLFSDLDHIGQAKNLRDKLLKMLGEQNWKHSWFYKSRDGRSGQLWRLGFYTWHDFALTSLSFADPVMIDIAWDEYAYTYNGMKPLVIDYGEDSPIHLGYNDSVSLNLPGMHIAQVLGCEILFVGSLYEDRKGLRKIGFKKRNVTKHNLSVVAPLWTWTNKDVEFAIRELAIEDLLLDKEKFGMITVPNR